MTDSMIHRVKVAIAIARATGDDIEAQARAAMEAMRQPTQAMLAAPHHEEDGCDAQYRTDDDFRDAWRAMIDAALKVPSHRMEGEEE